MTTHSIHLYTSAESNVAIWLVMMVKEWDLNGLEVFVTPLHIFSPHKMYGDSSSFKFHYFSFASSFVRTSYICIQMIVLVHGSNNLQHLVLSQQEEVGELLKSLPVFLKIGDWIFKAAEPT
jgi:hypothetical protein